MSSRMFWISLFTSVIVPSSLFSCLSAVLTRDISNKLLLCQTNALVHIPKWCAHQDLNLGPSPFRLMPEADEPLAQKADQPLAEKGSCLIEKIKRFVCPPGFEPGAISLKGSCS